MATQVNVTGDTPIAIKISINDGLKKLKLPLKDLGADVLPSKIQHLLGIPENETIILERFSDSAGGYIVLDPSNPAVFKTLIRAAKAKLKLRLRATIPSQAPPHKEPRSAEHFIENLKAQQEALAKLAAFKDPIIARTPVYPPPNRESTAFDGRSVGPGIFQFKDARAMAQQQQQNGEAPVPQPFTVDALTRDYAAKTIDLALRGKPGADLVAASTTPSWSVYCNECDAAMSDSHFHCSICDGGDYDLCQRCVDNGKLCPGVGHWLVRRFVKDGKVVSSTTERLAPKPKNKDILVQTMIKQEVEKEMPGAFTDDNKTIAFDSSQPTRTCNSCVVVKPENDFVTCSVCEDFDLCLPCHSDNKHGHHPGHRFTPATPLTELSLMNKSMLPAGRNVRHQAICDGCDSNIYGVRHKCFTCPDYDLCDTCVKQAHRTHPQHRFAPLYDPIPMTSHNVARHHGVYCDGPACAQKPYQTYIHGVRYKCVVCHDTDFCASCEANPNHHHNKTHPLIKIKTPIRGLNVSTVSENPDGLVRGLGDKKMEGMAPASSASPVQTPVQTVADIQPSAAVETKTTVPKASTANLNAHFLRDAIADGTPMTANTLFTQVWTIRNPGPLAWPAGCSVRYVGGDNMLNIDDRHTSTASEVAEATESNVIGREVQQDEEVAFKVVMKVPAREGKAISYWRVKTADGAPFGHRLWCDIEVKTAATPPELKSLLPSIDSVPNPSLRGSMSRAEALRQHHARLMNERQRTHQRADITAATCDLTVPSSNMTPPWTPSYYAQYQQRINAMRQKQVQVQQQMQSKQGLLAASKAQFDVQGSSQKSMVFPPKDNFSPVTITQAMNSAAKKTEEIPAVGEDKQISTEEKPVTTTNDEDCEQTGEVMKGSQMIFPTLEKESPASSTYQSMTSSSNGSKGKAAYVEDEETGDKVADASAPSSQSSTAESESELELVSAPTTTVSTDIASAPGADGFHDIGDELEVLSADEDDDSEDDGFMTDEEWDILDASDQETVASK